MNTHQLAVYGSSWHVLSDNKLLSTSCQNFQATICDTLAALTHPKTLLKVLDGVILCRLAVYRTQISLLEPILHYLEPF